MKIKLKNNNYIIVIAINHILYQQKVWKKLHKPKNKKSKPQKYLPLFHMQIFNNKQQTNQ